MSEVNRISLLVAASLGSLVIIAIYILSTPLLGKDGNAIISIVAGMMAATAISAISRVLFRSDEKKNLSFVFSEDFARQSVDKIIEAEFHEIPSDRMERQFEDAWEPTSQGLLGQDPALALAKIRIDLEREIRRISYVSDVSLNSKRTSLSGLIRMLGRHEVIEKRLVSAILDILPVCNEAIHGGKVSADMAVVVIDIGEDILRILKKYPKESTVAQNTQRVS